MAGKLSISFTALEGTPEIQLVRIAGFLDAATYRELSTRAAPLLAKPKPYFIFDLSSLEYLGSAGVASLMDIAYTSQDKEGEVAIAGPSQKVRDVLKTLGLADILTILPTVDDAVASLRSGTASPIVESRSTAQTTANPFGSRPVEFVSAGGSVTVSPASTGSTPPPPAASLTASGASPQSASGSAAHPPGGYVAAAKEADAFAALTTRATETAVPASDAADLPDVSAPPTPASSAGGASNEALLRELAHAHLALAEKLGMYLDESRRGMSEVASVVDRLKAVLAKLGPPPPA